MNFCGMFGGFLAEHAVSGMSLRLYIDRSFSLVDFADYVPATVKTMVFGFIIAITSSYPRLHDTRAEPKGSARASTRAVVLSSILIIVTNVLLVRIIFFIFPSMAADGVAPAARIEELRGQACARRRVVRGARRPALVILGRSGTGKSVTLRHIVGLVRPDRGHVLVDGRDITAMSRPELTDTRRRIGFLFQNAALFDSISVGENVAFPLRRHTGCPIGRSEPG